MLSSTLAPSVNSPRVPGMKSGREASQKVEARRRALGVREKIVVGYGTRNHWVFIPDACKERTCVLQPVHGLTWAEAPRSPS